MTSVKQELHDLVDRLGNERAETALDYLRRLLSEDAGPASGTASAFDRSMAPRVVSGGAFFDAEPADLKTLAARQGVQPVRTFDDLLGDFWPDTETADDFIATVREWRREGGCA